MKHEQNVLSYLIELSFFRIVLRPDIFLFDPLTRPLNPSFLLKN
jgi:hypothetical protein